MNPQQSKQLKVGTCNLQNTMAAAGPFGLVWFLKWNTENGATQQNEPTASAIHWSQYDLSLTKITR